MNLYTLLIIPFLYGLFGFIEPCSLGANILLLARIQHYPKWKRIREAIIFTLVRGFFLALMGILAAYIGQKFVNIQTSLFIILGSIFILLGIASLINIRRPVMKSLNLGKYLQNRGTVTLGVVFGLIIPACAIVFVLALMSSALLAGNLFEGFVSLFVFGVTLSAPLIVLSWFEKSNDWIKKLYGKTQKLKWLAGVILIIVGILTLLSSVWWSGAV